MNNLWVCTSLKWKEFQCLHFDDGCALINKKKKRINLSVTLFHPSNISVINVSESSSHVDIDIVQLLHVRMTFTAEVKKLRKDIKGRCIVLILL